MKKKILFVCMGNICRSPAAEGIFLRMAEEAGRGEEFEIDSAGTYGGHAGELPDGRMRAAALRRGYKLTHRSRQVRKEDFRDFDLILAMDEDNYERLCRVAPDRAGIDKVERMTAYCRRHTAREIPDPYYSGNAGFDLVIDLLEDACATLLEES